MPYLLYYFCLVIKKNYLAKKVGGHGPPAPRRRDPWIITKKWNY